MGLSYLIWHHDGESCEVWLLCKGSDSSLGRKIGIRDNTDDSNCIKTTIVLVLVSPRKGIGHRGSLMTRSMDNSTKRYSNHVMVSHWSSDFSCKKWKDWWKCTFLDVCRCDLIVMFGRHIEVIGMRNIVLFEVQRLDFYRWDYVFCCRGWMCVDG